MSQLHTEPETQDHNPTDQPLIFETANDFIIYSLKKKLGIDLNWYQNENNDQNDKPNSTNQTNNITGNEIDTNNENNDNNVSSDVLSINSNQTESDNKSDETTQSSSFNSSNKTISIEITPINPNNSKNDDQNPYLDMELMKGIEQFSPDKNKKFEAKYKKHNQTNEESEEKTSNDSDSSQCEYIGILKWFYNDKKYGFIEYNQNDLFVHESDFINILPNEIANIINKCVSFNIESYTDKKTQRIKRKAINVNIIDNNNKHSNKKGIHKGTLLFFNKLKKFGFIECETDKNITTLFVYESEIKFDFESIYKGMRLQFDIEIYMDNFGESKKKAINVDMDDSMENNNFGEYKSKRGMHNGTLLWFDENKKFGFIKCENHTGLFVHQTEIKFDQRLIYDNMPLTFDIELDSVQFDNFGQTKRKAVNVNIDLEKEIKKEKCHQKGMHSGTLLWFDKSKKFGFIQTQNDGGVFVHDSELKFDKRLIHEGMILTFDIELDTIQLDNCGQYKRKAVNVDIDDDYIDF